MEFYDKILLNFNEIFYAFNADMEWTTRDSKSWVIKSIMFSETMINPLCW